MVIEFIGVLGEDIGSVIDRKKGIALLPLQSKSKKKSHLGIGIFIRLEGLVGAC